MLKKLKYKIFKTPFIEFMCEEDDWDVVPKPYPAKKLMPDWYKALPMKLGDKGLNSSTIKRCNPVLDAMSLGWIIPTPIEFSLHPNANGSKVDVRHNYHKDVIGKHTHQQVTHPKCPNPLMPHEPLKLLNFWITRPAPGYSLLFVPPLNRADPRFTIFTGLVDCDKYFEFVNFPFVMNKNEMTVVAQGTPWVQVIPIKRDSLIKSTSTTKMTKKELAALSLQRRKRAAQQSLYRDVLREDK